MKAVTGKGAGKDLVVRVQMWNAGYKQACSVYTFKGIIKNAIIGVTEVSLFKQGSEN
jgi:ribosomal protein L6P/L9E